ncbi:MAG: pitrilysin family protein [Candidatus Sumerlaeota bacterium]|nr:pitrilysin family protein [Candidatus Sumerlaeota bacterium]
MKFQKRIYLLLPLLAAIWIGCVSSQQNIPSRPEQLTFQEIKFNPPKPERFEGPNGMMVYLLTDKELPLVSITAWLRIGQIHEPADKVGLAKMTGEVMRTGGSNALPYEKMDEELEFLAAEVESNIGEEFGRVGMSCLKKDLPRVGEIFAMVLRDPAFAPEKVELARNQMVETIRRRNDDPEEVARREFRFLTRGKESPWARVPHIAALKNVTREDLIAFYKKFVTPDRIILAVSGDVTREELTKLLNERFGSWTAKGASLPAVAPVPPDPPASVNLIELDKTQSQIRMGHLGPRRSGKDEPVFDVFNEIFGMGMTSRLFQDVRSARGLAYAVFGFLTPGADRGVFAMAAGTKTERTAECVAALTEQAKALFTKPPTQEEIEESKAAIIKKEVFSYDSPAKIVNRRAELELLGYPSDFMETYIGRVRAVTADDLQRVIKENLHSDRFVILVVGASKKFDRPLSEFGAIRTIEMEKAE